MAEFQALLRAKAEWKPHQIAKAGDIGALAEAAKDLAEVVKKTLSLASVAMEIVKLLELHRPSWYISHNNKWRKKWRSKLDTNGNCV